jgi:biotin carboxyl carrier protein
LHYDVEVEGRTWRVVIHRVGDGFAVAVGGRTWRIDAARIDAQTLSLIVDDERPAGVSEGHAASLAATSRGGVSVEATVSSDTKGQLVVRVGPVALAATLDGARRRRGSGEEALEGPQRLVAPMPGKIVRVLVGKGDAVSARQPLLVVEAMKMENELRATRDGTVAEVYVTQGASVDAGASLMEIR